MSIFEELLALDWPGEFVVEYADGSRERLLRGEGIALAPPSDDPVGSGFLSADLPAKHPRYQKRVRRVVRFTELRGIFASDGRRLWPTA
jgi:hypothetical protein